jgi:hypothetical protein
MEPFSNSPNSMLTTLEKLIRKNVVLYFANRPAEDKTVEKVEAFAQKQLDFFINGMIKQSPDLQKAWKNGQPFMAKAAIHRETLSFEIQIVEKEPGKF